MGTRLIQVPYDSGMRDRRMGRGPAYLVERGIMARLERDAGPVRSVVVEWDDGFPTEGTAAFALQRGVAEQVRAARAAGELPLILAGNCNTTVGAIGGLAPRRVGLVWFDAHGDLNTPDTTPSGFLDGMALSMVTGACWTAVTATVPGFEPLPEERIALVGARELDPAEVTRLAASQIAAVGADDLRARGAEDALGPVIDRWRGAVDGVHLHLDMDVHDPREAAINPYQGPGGLATDEVRDCLRVAAARLPVLSASITSYDPASDPAGTGAAAALDAASLLAALASGRA